MSDPAKPQRKSFGPESDFLQTLKGKAVHVETVVVSGTMHEKVSYDGTLLWVDRYSLGLLVTPYLALSGTPLPPVQKMFFKSALLSISPAKEPTR